MNATEQNKNTVTSFIQALFTKGDLGAVDEYRPAPRPVRTVALAARLPARRAARAADRRGHRAHPAAQVSSLLLSAYGFTGAQSRVVAVIKGHSTRQIVEELHISQHTVQEHLTAAFDKLGVRSRRELVATMLAGPPA